MHSPFSGQQPIQAETIIRRGEIKDREAVCEAAWRLTNASAMAAHWSPMASMAYCAAEEPRNTLQAKVIFVAYAAAKPNPNLSIPNENARSGKIVGFAAFSAVTTAGPGECSLENLAVAVEWQEQGIGTRLLTAGLLWCRAQLGSSVWLEARVSNRAAIALYERAGFAAVGRRPGYYTHPDEDALQMCKEFDHSR